ncbi:MAG TPA: hypothetical protein VGD81_13125 [Opitutaceae bacterium]
MPINPAFAFGLVVVSCALISPLAAQPVTITAEGQLEHVSNPSLAPPLIRERPRTFVSVVIDRQATPISSDQETATYRPRSATLTIGDESFPLQDAVLIVERFPHGPSSGYAYLIRGSTQLGWFFSLRSGSKSPSYVPDFEVPTSLPVGEPDFAHDVTLRDERFGWDAYGDGAITMVSSTPTAFVRGG